MSLDVLYQDDQIVAVNKPSGWLVHRTALEPRATEIAMIAVRDQIGREVFPVHRLDRPTSGVLLFALNPAAARALGEEFAAHRVEKKYLAVVRGVPATAVQRIDHALREEHDRIADTKARADKPPQAAVTDIECLAGVELAVAVDKYPTSRYGLVEARPLTGRKHQIRRHLNHISHPIIGDVQHGKGKHNRFFEERFGVRRLLLACTGMTFQHPTRLEKVSVKAPLCPQFLRVMHALGWEGHAAAFA